MKIQNKQIGTYEKVALKSGRISYKKQLRLGVDALTGKEVITTVSGKSFTELKEKIEQRKRDFEARGTVAKPKSITFRELADLYLAMYLPDVKVATRRNLNRLFATYLVPAFGAYKVEKITPMLIQKQLNKWGEEAAKPMTGKRREKGRIGDYGRLLSYVRSVLGYGITLGYLEQNPARAIKVPKRKSTSPEKMKYLTKEQVLILLDGLEELAPVTPFQQAPSHLYRAQLMKVLLYLLLHTGLRIGEALALEWTDMDESLSKIHIHKTVTDAGVQDSPKTDASIRSLQLDQETMKRLLAWRKSGPETRYMFQSHAAQKPIPMRTVQAYTARLYQRLGLPEVGLHGLRHTHATLLLNAGVPYKDIQERHGHSDYMLTLNTYAHLYENSESGLLTRLAEFVGVPT